jgi:hypothetical protein
VQLNPHLESLQLSIACATPELHFRSQPLQLLTSLLVSTQALPQRV